VRHVENDLLYALCYGVLCTGFSRGLKCDADQSYELVVHNPRCLRGSSGFLMGVGARNKLEQVTVRCLFRHGGEVDDRRFHTIFT